MQRNIASSIEAFEDLFRTFIATLTANSFESRTGKLTIILIPLLLVQLSKLECSLGATVFMSRICNSSMPILANQFRKGPCFFKILETLGNSLDHHPIIRW